MAETPLLRPVNPEDYIQPNQVGPAPLKLRPVNQATEQPDIVQQGWETYRARQYADSYAKIKKMAETQYANDPKGMEEELQKIQLSYFLADRAGQDPIKVYGAWDSRGWNPYAEDYFKAKDLPSTWFGWMKDELSRAVHTYKANNIAASMVAGGFSPERFKAFTDELAAMPAPSHPTDSGSVFNFIKRLPAGAISQLPMLLDMGITEFAAGGLAAAATTLLGAPEAAGTAFQFGRRVGGWLAGSKLGAGIVMTDALQTPDPATGKPAYKVMDPEQLIEATRKMAAVGGAITGVGMMIGVESVGGALRRKAGEEILQAAGEKGIFKTFMGQMLAKYGKNAGTQMTMMDLQGVINEAFRSKIMGDVNAKTGTAFPTSTNEDLVRLAIQGLPGALEATALIALPGSFMEARASFRQILERNKVADAQARIDFAERASDPSRPVAERVADVQGRLKELSATQEALQAKVDASIARGKPDEQAIRDQAVAKAEHNYFSWLQREQQNREPGQAWQGTRAQWEEAQAAKKAAEPPAREVAAATPGEGSAVLREGLQGRFEGSPRPGETFGSWSARQAEYVRAGDESRIVNPIDPTLSSGEKAQELRRLSDENAPIVEAALKKVADEMGLEYGVDAKTSYKAPDVIVEKGARPSILEKNPLHDVEHIRDAYRFKVVSNKLEDFAQALQRVMQETGASLVKMDADKLFAPKEWGWRFAGADLRMPNGQLVEFYSPLKELEAAKKAGNHDLFEKWRNVSESDLLKDPELWKERDADIKKSNEVYDAAFAAAMKRLGIQESDAAASWSSAKASGFGLEESPSLSKLDMRSSAEGIERAQTPSLRTSVNEPQRAQTLPSSGSIEIAQSAASGLEKSTTFDRGAAIEVPSYKNIPSGAEWFKSQGVSQESPVVAKIRANLPNLTTEQAQGSAMFVKLLAASRGESLDAWMDRTFTREVFSKERAAQMEAEGRRGGIDFKDIERIGKLIYYTTKNSDFGNFVHEMTHAFELDLTNAELGIINRGMGFKAIWTERNREDFAGSFIAYMRGGHVPNEEMRPIFDRYARWINSIYTDARDNWELHPDIVSLYSEILSAQTRAPKDHPPEDIGLAANGDIVFETRPGDEKTDPRELRPEEFLLQSAFHAAWAKPYLDAQGQVRPDVSSRTTPAPELRLKVGQWMVDDGFRGIYGHEIAQLREVDPSALTLNEPDYTQGEAWGFPDREKDAARYAEWRRAGSTPPPITVMETQKGTLLVSDGHRRVAAAKMAGMPVIAWVWPAMDHPEGLHLSRDPSQPIMRVGLTYEGATGRVWPADSPAKQNIGMTYETRPGDKDPWILKSRAVLIEKMKGPQPATNIKNMLLASGIKDEEMEWLGLNDLLKGNKKLTPQEVLDYIEAHAIKIQEVVRQEVPQDLLNQEIEAQRQKEIDEEYSRLSDRNEAPGLNYEIVPEPDPTSGEPSFGLKVDGQSWENYPTEEEAQAEATKLEDQAFSDFESQLYSQAEDNINRYLERQNQHNYLDNLARASLKEKGLLNEPVFKQYSLAGADVGYRELLMKLPLIQGGKGAWIATNPKTGERQQANTFGEMKGYQERGWKIEEAPGAPLPAYQSPHWSEPNVLLHLRFDERQGNEGQRILFIEEIQSDWHQAGKREGYVENARPAELGPEFTVRRVTQEDVDAYGGNMKVGDWALIDSSDEIITDAPATSYPDEAAAKMGFARDAEAVGVHPEDMGGTKGEIPNAPFKKTWPELGFRRALRWAAENGFDEVAWTTGEQQADRYDLGKQVDRISITRLTDGSFKWEAYKDKRNVVSQEAKDVKELETQVGKDLAAKASAQRLGVESYSGVDLKVGGEGMKAFYDRQLVDIAKKIAKKYGSSVGMTTIGEAAGVEDRIHSRLMRIMERDDGFASDAAARILGAMDEGTPYEEALRHEQRIDRELADLIDADTLIQQAKSQDTRAADVHSMKITEAMRVDVMTGQMLFEPGPHEESVRQAVEKGMPVPDRVLQEYADRPWAQEEQAKRDNLVEAARTVDSFPAFFDWQARSHPDQHLSEDYYQNVWNRAKETAAAPELKARTFVDAMDDQALRYTIGGFALVNQDQNPNAQKQLTTEMKELGRRVVAGEDPGDLYQTVREQIKAEPDRWRSFFERYLPDDVHQELQTSMDAADLLGFKPVLPKVANERFTDSLRTPEQMEIFLRTVGNEGLTPRSKFLARMAERIESTDIPLDELRTAQALREIRKNITTYREAWATATGDEVMLRQLDAELEAANVTEEQRIRTENSRLRAELKKSLEAVQQTALRQTWTQADLTKAIKQREADTASYQTEIATIKKRLKDSVQALRTQYKNEAKVKGVIDQELQNRRMAKVKEKNAADVVILKARVKQVRELGRQRLQQERDRQAIERYAETINRPINAGIADDQARQIEDIQRRIQYDKTDVSESTLNRLREWRRQNPDAPMPSALVQAIEARDPRLITAGEMRQLYDQVKALRSAGRKERMNQLLIEREFIDTNIGLVEKSIRQGRKPKEIIGLGTKGALRATRTGMAKRVLWATWRMNRIAEMMDGGKPGPVTAWLWRYVNDATDTTIRSIDSYSKENRKMVDELKLSARDFGKQERIEGLTITRGQMVGVYIYSQFDDGLISLRQDNNIPEPTIAAIVKALTPQEKRYGDWMIDTLSSDKDFDRLQAVQLTVSNQRMDRLERYFPIQRQGMSGNPLLSDLARELLDMAGKSKNPRPRAGFLKSRYERQEGVTFPPLRLDAPAIFMDHINKREFYIANAELIKRMNRIFDSKPVKEAMADRYGDAMQPLVQKYIGQYTNPNIYRAVEDYGEFARILRGNLGMSLIGSNVMTILKQLPDIPQIMIQAGPIEALRAAAQFIASPRKTLERMWEMAPQLKQRSYDRFIEELKTYDRNGYERVVKAVGEAGFAVLKAMDTVTNVIGWTAVYNREMRRTGNDNLAAKAARDFILKKRPAARAKDLAAIYRSQGLSWFLMFTNQQNQQWNILTHDIPQSFRQGLAGNGAAMLDAFMNVTALAVGAIGMGIITRKGIMTGASTVQDLLNMMFGNSPFIGNALEAALRGQPEQNPLNPFGGAYQVGKIMYDVANQADTDKAMRDLQNILFTLGGTLGFPVVQAKRIYKTIESGDPWDFFGGPPKGGS